MTFPKSLSHLRLGLVGAVLVLLFFTFAVLFRQRSTTVAWGDIPSDRGTQDSVSLNHPNPVSETNDAVPLLELPLPVEYELFPDGSTFCEGRYGTKYLSGFRDSVVQYCTQDSSSSLQCFHTRTTDSRTDTFCVGRSSIYSKDDRKFELDCKQSTPAVNPALGQFTGYWYDTGPKHIFEKFINTNHDRQLTEDIAHSARSFSVLVKREGESNVWHCLMEIMSLTWTFDVMRMTRDPITQQPLFTEADIQNTQIVILDERQDGPYWDLWQLFAQQPIIRVDDMNSTDLASPGNIIIPLAGGSNPLWQGDWAVRDCQHSELLSVFSTRVMNFYSIQPSQPTADQIVVTFINRVEGRRLIDQDALLQLAKSDIPHIHIQSIDFAAISFKEQIQIIRDTDILVGVHGAGLAHIMWMKPGSAVVEILPYELGFKGFRNLAGLMDLGYFSAHADQPAEGDETKEWHWQDVILERTRWLDLMRMAATSMYNRGTRNFDVT
jgi:EGF domain-specific O-GlcNAc transferase